MLKNKRQGHADPVKIFVLSVTVSALIYFIIYAIIGNGRFADIFFKRCADFFMDFFNSVRDASQGSAVYTERHVIYPPMANLIYLIFSRFTPNAYNDTDFTDRFEWHEYASPMMLTVIISTAFAIIFCFIVYSRLEHPSRYLRFAFAFFAFFSAPLLYMTERGNMMIFCMISLMIYAFTYGSKSRLHREIGLLCLAFAFSIKLYPVVFGWLLISDKRYKDAIRCAVYGLLMLIIPSFFFGGPVCFVHLFNNIFNFSAGTDSTLSTILNYIGASAAGKSVFTAAVYVWVMICGICFAVSPFITDDKWKTWTVGLATILCVPSLTSNYGWAFFIIPIIMICNKHNRRRSDMLYVIFMTIPFIFLPFRINYYVTPTTVAVYVMTAVLSVYSVADTVMMTVKRLRQRKIAESN